MDPIVLGRHEVRLILKLRDPTLVSLFEESDNFESMLGAPDFLELPHGTLPGRPFTKWVINLDSLISSFQS